MANDLEIVVMCVYDIRETLTFYKPVNRQAISFISKSALT